MWLKKLENSRQDLAGNPNKDSRLQALGMLTSFFRYLLSSYAPRTTALLLPKLLKGLTVRSYLGCQYPPYISHTQTTQCGLEVKYKDTQTFWEVQSSRWAENSPVYLQDHVPCRVENHTSKVNALDRKQIAVFHAVTCKSNLHAIPYNSLWKDNVSYLLTG